MHTEHSSHTRVLTPDVGFSLPQLNVRISELQNPSTVNTARETSNTSHDKHNHHRLFSYYNLLTCRNNFLIPDYLFRNKRRERTIPMKHIIVHETIRNFPKQGKCNLSLFMTGTWQTCCFQEEEESLRFWCCQSASPGLEWPQFFLLSCAPDKMHAVSHDDRRLTQ